MPSLVGFVASTSSPGSNRRSFLDIINELARPVDADDSTVRALAADAFRSAVRTMNRRGLWPWEILEEDIAITANERFSSTLGGAIKKPLSMHFLNGTVEDQPIDYDPYDSFIEKYSLDVTGQPTVYTIPNLFETGQIRWFPTSSANDTARFAYYRVTPIPMTEDETVEIPDYATETYMTFAWAEFMKRLPSTQQVIPLAIAIRESQSAFRELAAHVNTPGDRSRIVSHRGMW